MARFAAGEFPLGELDARLKEAVQADGRDTLAQAYAAESEARSGGGRRRRASTVTVMGRVRFAYRYSDGRGADEAGIKGKNGEEAGTRESKLLTATFYDRVDKRGRPIVNEGCIVYYSSTKPSDEFISEVNALVNEMGYTRIQRVQFISDGAAWLEKLAKQVFADGKVLRVIDFYHACEYLGLVVRELSGDAAWKADFAKLKKLMKAKGARAAIAEIERMFGAPSVADLDGDAAKALAYLRSRLQYMEYGTYREDGYYIGSGTVESACKSVVAARCKLAGMHWRLATVDAITILRATLRSRLPIAA